MGGSYEELELLLMVPAALKYLSCLPQISKMASDLSSLSLRDRVPPIPSQLPTLSNICNLPIPGSSKPGASRE